MRKIYTVEEGFGVYDHKTFNSMIRNYGESALFSDWFESYLYAMVMASKSGFKYDVYSIIPGQWTAEPTPLKLEKTIVTSFKAEFSG